MKILSGIFLIMAFCACKGSDDNVLVDDTEDCESSQVLDDSRGVCEQDLAPEPLYNQSVQGNTRTINSNSIPAHLVGLFGGGQGSRYNQ